MGRGKNQKAVKKHREYIEKVQHMYNWSPRRQGRAHEGTNIHGDNGLRIFLN